MANYLLSIDRYQKIQAVHLCAFESLADEKVQNN